MLKINSRVMTHLDVLVNQIGARPAGSLAHRRAAEYIRTQFQESGLELSEVSVDFPEWTLQFAQLQVAGQDLPLDVNPFSPACDIDGELIAVSTIPELAEADITGKITLLYGELAKAPIFPINFEPIQFERDQTINRLLMEKQSAAVLTVNLHPWRRIHIFEDEDFPIPSATISSEVGRELLTRQGDVVQLSIQTKTQPTQIQTIIGKTKPQHTQRIVICAHYDTKVGTPGAFDNGSGMAAVLALAEDIATQNLGVDLEFVAWGDEEYGAHTDGVYVRQFGHEFDQLLCAINLDGIGLALENTTLTMLAHSPAFEEVVRDVQANYPAVVWVEPWVQSNHSTFAMRKVPSLALTSLTWERAHQGDDSMDWLSATKLDEAMALVQEIIHTIQNYSPDWTRA